MSARSDRHRPETAGEGEIIRLRRSLIRLQDETRLLRRDIVRRKYNPSQPRVPAGGTGGGQWTSGAGGGGGSGGSTMPGFGDGGDLAEFAPEAGFVIDETGNEAWAFYEESREEDGAVSERAIVNRDGSTIHSEYAASREAGFDERHTVTTPDGDKVTFEITDKSQTIREGGPDGEAISRSVWTPSGPEPVATVQPAYSGLRQGVGAAGAVLFGWLSGENRADGPQAVMGFNARDFRPSENAGGALDLTFVGKVEQAEAETACKYLPELQSRLDRAVSAAGPANNYPHAAIYGTFIHQYLKDQIEDARYPDLKAEQSFAKQMLESTPDEFVRYGYPRSVRIDAYELREDGTLCIYDFKTGRRGIDERRWKELAVAPFRAIRNISRVVVIEVRPSS